MLGARECVFRGWQQEEIAMRVLVTAVLIAMGGLVANQDPGLLRPLLDFATPESARQWQAVNDGVMGGVSQGRFRITDARTMEFSGNLSLENNGGFASVRTKPTALDIKSGDTLVVRVKGDGRDYMVNIYTKSRRMAFSYRADLSTEQDQWQEIHLPLGRFEPTSFGRVVAGMGAVDPDQINGLGFMLSDKKPGAFRLEIESVKVIRGAD
jgi:monofunctional biosynthetic peptidoglycan transglycosylase